MKYKCSSCGMAVIVFNGKSHTACKCGAPIVAEMSGGLIGHGGIQKS